MKPCVLVFILSFISISAGCQVSVGIAAGLNESRFHFANPNYGTSLEPGLYAGVTGARAFGSHWTLRADLLYSEEGTRETLVGGNGSGYTRYDYLDIPVLLQFRPFPGFFVEAGPQLGFLLSARETFDGVSDDLRQDTHPIEISTCIGVGYEFRGRLPRLGVEARFAPGLTELNSIQDNGSAIHSQVWSLGLAYRVGE